MTHDEEGSLLHELANEAAGHWQGSPLRLIRNRENAVFEMLVPGGRAALRLHREGYQDDAAIQSELWWCNALAMEGVAVPATLTAHNGMHLVALSTGRKASAIAWIQGEALGELGRPLDRPLSELLFLFQELGRLLARIHATTDRLTLPTGYVRPRWDIAGLVGEAPLWGRFWDHPAATPDQRARLHEIRGFLRDLMTRYQDEGGDFGLIHADVLRENILVNDRSLTLIDFDDSGFGFRFYDLGTALYQNIHEPSYPDLRDALMEGFGTTDRKMVEGFALARACASVGWVISRLGPDDPIHRQHLARAGLWADRAMSSCL